MQFRASHAISLLAVIIIGLWFWMNSGDNAKAGSKKVNNIAEKLEAVTAPESDAAKNKARPQVVVQNIRAVAHQNSFRLYGRTEANREVAVKAETMGLVKSTPAQEGAAVKRGDILCRQDIDARQARVDQARAAFASAEFDLNSTKTLVEKGYRSAVQLAKLQAQLDGARASVKQAEIELDNVNMRAPFAGVFEMRMAEVGDYLAPGQACGMLIELDPMVVAADLSETQIANIKIGQDAAVELATGETLTGRVRMIESRANPSTRTFRTEITLPNPDLTLKGGVTATVQLGAGAVKAHLIPSHILAISEDGQVGVRYLDYDDTVRFAQTKTIDEQASGVWVTGLPDQTRLIVQGQDFVSVGVKVDAVLDGTQR
ncbi:MAG: efflux RND transporter periplasmic adaptor subunit [Maricaulaceae bacterium]